MQKLQAGMSTQTTSQVLSLTALRNNTTSTAQHHLAETVDTLMLISLPATSASELPNDEEQECARLEQPEVAHCYQMLTAYASNLASYTCSSERTLHR